MVQDARPINRGAVLAHVIERRTTSRKDVADTIGISVATTQRVLEQLKDEGLVRETTGRAVGRGRPPLQIELVADAACAVGVDLGTDTTRCRVLDLAGDEIAAATWPTPDLPTTDLARWVAGRALGCLAPRHGAFSVAVGLPGAVDLTQRVVRAARTPQLEDPRFIDDLAAALGRPPHVDNDANHALAGELTTGGAAAGADNAAVVLVGKGLGVGLAVDGRILRGTRGLVGEFGVLPVDGRGRTVEEVVNGAALLTRAAELGVRVDHAGALFTAPRARLVPLLADFDRAMALALIAVTAAGDPAVVVLGGAIGQHLTPRLPDYAARVHRALGFAPELRTSTLGENACSVGAARVALEDVRRVVCG